MTSRPKLCPDQVVQMKAYLQTLHDLRGGNESVEAIFSYEDFAGMTVLYGQIEKLGNGCPIKAAHRHSEVMQSVKDAIRDTNGGASKAMH